MKIFQQIAEGRFFLLHVPEIHLGIEVNGAENIAQLSAVMFFNVRQGHVDLLTDFVAVAFAVKEIKGGLFID